MNDLFLTGLIATLIGAIGTLSYALARKVERNADFAEKEEAAAEVRRLRNTLDNPDVVDKLHEKFKR
ncbi:MAG: hypothetical protein J5781_00135 [Clostridia bacterium]|nr:hypothetical protein [Clostridia bacterium]